MLKTETEYLQRIADNVVFHFVTQIGLDIEKRYGHKTKELVRINEDQYRAAYDTLREYGAEMRQAGRAELMREMRAAIDARGINAGAAHLLQKQEPDQLPDTPA